MRSGVHKDNSVFTARLVPVHTMLKSLSATGHSLPKRDLGESVWEVLRLHHASRRAQGGELAGQNGPKGFCEQELESSRPERWK